MKSQMEKVLHLLERATGKKSQRSGNGYLAFCPVCKSEDPTVHVMIDANGGILLQCKNHCSSYAILDKTRLSLNDLLPERILLKYPYILRSIDPYIMYVLVKALRRIRREQQELIAVKSRRLAKVMNDIAAEENIPYEGDQYTSMSKVSCILKQLKIDRCKESQKSGYTWTLTPKELEFLGAENGCDMDAGEALTVNDMERAIMNAGCGQRLEGDALWELIRMGYSIQA